MRNRWDNYGLWVSIISLVGLAFTNYLPANFELIANSVLTVLVGAGIISNPKEGKGYLDQ